jgi:hypothetical protein
MLLNEAEVMATVAVRDVARAPSNILTLAQG